MILWEPLTLKQVLANQCGPRQLQRPSGRVLLVIVYKDADLQHASLSQLRLYRDSLSGAQTVTSSLLAAIPSANARKTAQLAVGLLPTQGILTSQPAAAGVSPAFTGHTLPLSYSSFQGPKHLTSYCTLCLPTRLYILPTAINICCRNLRGCLSKYSVRHPTVP